MRNSLFSRLRTCHRPAKEEHLELFGIVSRRTCVQHDMAHRMEKTQDSVMPWLTRTHTHANVATAPQGHIFSVLPSNHLGGSGRGG